jgi:LysM repeat protein
MKRQLSCPLACLGLFACLAADVRAQDPVATAAREEAAENYRTVSAKVNLLEEELHSYQKRMTKLTEEIYKLRDELDRQKNRNENAATLEKISKLQDAIKQVDEARQEDNKRVLEKIARLQTAFEKAIKGIATAPAPAPPVDEPRHEAPSSRSTPKAPPENSYKYTIKRGDTLSGIVTALKAQGYKVSMRQIEEANPGVNWSKLAVGRDIIIPPPTPSP